MSTYNFVSDVLSVVDVGSTNVWSEGTTHDIDFTIELGTTDLNAALSTVFLKIPITDRIGNDTQQNNPADPPYTSDEDNFNAFRAISLINDMSVTDTQATSIALLTTITQALTSLFDTDHSDSVLILNRTLIAAWFDPTLKDSIFTDDQVGCQYPLTVICYRKV
jgi:hypothetical protein